MARTPAGTTRGYVLTESRAPVVRLTSARVGLLAESAAAGVPIVLATDEPPLLSPAFAEVWQEAGAGWVVRSPDDSLRDGFTGRRLRRVADVLKAGSGAAEDLAVNHLRPMPADAVELLVTVSIRHRSRSAPVLGHALELLAVAAAGAPPTGWAAHEPAEQPWSVGSVTAYERDRMEAECVLVADGPLLTATLTVRRTTQGVDEIVRAHVNLGRPGEVDLAAVESRVISALADVAVGSTPEVGLVLVRPARADLLVPPVLQHPASPLALLLGGAALATLPAEREVLGGLGGVVLGAGPGAGMIFPLGSPSQEPWPQLEQILGGLRRRRPDLLRPLAALLRSHG